ncbi:MAG: hypothetical protein R3D84_00320 [Paracoccaceae bacterium]
MTRGWPLALAVGIALAALGAAAMGGGNSGALPAGCQGEAPAAADPALCATFLDRLGAAYPGRAFRAPKTGETAMVTLVVTAATGNRLAARIDWRGSAGLQPGPVMAAIVADGAMDGPMATNFLDALIRETPAP